MTSSEMWWAVGLIVLAVGYIGERIGDRIDNAAGRIIAALTRNKDY